MTGVQWIELPTHTDARGSLVSFDIRQELPFEVRRIYYLFHCPQGAVRGQHAQSADQVLVALQGSVTIELNNGWEEESLILDRPHQALHVRAGVWARLRNFSCRAILLVASPRAYAEVTYYDCPQPHLVGCALEEARP